MQLEYFQLIDRILDLNVAEKTITVEAQVPEHHTIFEGHFPGFPIMPGVLLTEAMAQSSGWLLLGVMNFERMPFLAMVKERGSRIAFCGPSSENATVSFKTMRVPRRLPMRYQRLRVRKRGTPSTNTPASGLI